MLGAEITINAEIKDYDGKEYSFTWVDDAIPGHKYTVRNIYNF